MRDLDDGAELFGTESSEVVESRWRFVGPVVAVIGGLVFVLRGALWHPINSDDVAWHVAFRTWRPGAETLVLPENSYLLKVPLFMAADALGSSSVASVVIQSMLLNALALYLVWHFARYAATVVLGPGSLRSRIEVDLIAAVAVVFTWASSELTWDLTARLTNRNLELGLIAALLELLHRSYRADDVEVPSAWFYAAVGVLIGGVLVNDPLIAYTVVLPFVVLLGGLALARRWNHGVRGPLIICLVALASWRIFRFGIGLVGVDQVSLGATLASVRDVPGQVLVGLDGVARTFGVTVFYESASSAAFWLGAIRLFVFLGATVLTIRWCARARRVDAAGAALLWAGLLFSAFVLSTFGASLVNIRYVAVMVAAGPAVLASVLVRLGSRARLFVCGILVVAISWAMVPVFGELGGPESPPNVAAIGMAEALAEVAGDTDTVAYGDFWNAHVHSYFADLSPQVLAVGCASGLTVPRYWISDLSRFDRPPAQRSVFVYDSRPGLFTCPRADLLAQFGDPDWIRPVDSRELWVYERDLGLFFEPSL